MIVTKQNVITGKKINVELKEGDKISFRRITVEIGPNDTMRAVVGKKKGLFAKITEDAAEDLASNKLLWGAR